jgi:hypothetical protein
MSRDGYLPPGIEDIDIPGNRPGDIEFDNMIEWIAAFMSDRDITCDDIMECIESSIP